MPNAGGAILGMGYRIWHAAGFSLLALARVPPGDLTREGFVSGRRVSRGSRRAVPDGGRCGGRRSGARRDTALPRHPGSPARPGPDRRGLSRRGNDRARDHGDPRRARFGDTRRSGPAVQSSPGDSPPSGRAQPGGVASRLRPDALRHARPAGAFLALELLAASRRDPAGIPPVLRRLGLALILLVICFGVGGLPSDAIFSGAPLFVRALRLGRLRTRHQPLGAALAGFGAMGLLASHRRFFFLTDGPYVAPPLLFALVCAAGCVTLAVKSRPAPVPGRPFVARAGRALRSCRGRVLRPLPRIFSRRSRPGSRRTGMLSARPQVVRRIVELTARLRRETPPGAGVVVFPEGEILNYLPAGRTRSVTNYLPGCVTSFQRGGDRRRTVARDAPALW